jgi:NodT family efflux transporter outer membrane factor (OMF) lipoprotein
MNRFAPMLLPGLLLLSGCFRTHYRRPDLALPPAYRGEAAGTAGGDAGLGDLRWQDLIRDERLNELIQEALTNDYDVRLAAARVLEAAAQADRARSQQFPSFDGQAGYNNLRTARDGSSTIPEGYPAESSFTRFISTFSWELDLWGRIRNSTAAARAELLGSTEARRVVVATLVAEVAQTYFLLRDLDLEKEIVEESLKSRQESLELVQLRVDNGYSAELDLRQAEALVKSARASRTDVERQLEQAENHISFLLGRNPGPVRRGRSLLDQDLASELRPGLSSALLVRRPDIRQAEQELVSSNAQVAVAKAAFFPSISLTASTGFESAALRNVVSMSNGSWIFGPLGNLPIFNGGRIRAGLRGAEARKQQAVLSYQRTVLQAFREVADALVGRRKAAELRKEQEDLVESLRAAVELADLRYRGGVSSYLEYLDSEREHLDAKLRLVQVRRDELTRIVVLYLSLGGGWQ